MPAALGATRISINPLGAPLPVGAILDFSQTKAVLIAAAAIGTTSLKVKPLGSQLSSGATARWNGEVMINHDLYTYITLQEPLTNAISEGAELEFPTGKVILAREALQGATALYTHPVIPPQPGSTATFTPEPIYLPYSRKLIARGGARCGGATKYYPYSLLLNSLLVAGGAIAEFKLTRVIVGGAVTGGEVVLEATGLSAVGGTIASGSARLATLFVLGGSIAGGVTHQERLLHIVRGGAVSGGRVFSGRESIVRGGAIAGGSARTTFEFVSGGAIAGGGAELESRGGDELELLLFGDYSELEALLLNPFV